MFLFFSLAGSSVDMVQGSQLVKTLLPAFHFGYKTIDHACEAGLCTCMNLLTMTYELRILSQNVGF